MVAMWWSQFRLVVFEENSFSANQKQELPRFSQDQDEMRNLTTNKSFELVIASANQKQELTMAAMFSNESKWGLSAEDLTITTTANFGSNWPSVRGDYQNYDWRQTQSDSPHDLC